MHKILKIVAAALGLLGIIFLIRIISVGDEAIKAGDDGSVDPIAFVAYIILGLTLAFVIYFVIKNLFTNTGSLKNTLVGIGAFATVLIISYVLSGGSDAADYMYNGVAATEGESKIVGAGLIAFYILIFAAAATMVLSGVKKMIK